MRTAAMSKSSPASSSSSTVSMPIVRICASDWHNLSLPTSDCAPSRGSSSLYVFLKSVPTRVECQTAMAEFKKHVAAENYSSAFLRKNTALLSTVQEAVLDNLFLREIPAQSVSRSTWKDFFLHRGSSRQNGEQDEVWAVAGKNQQQAPPPSSAAQTMNAQGAVLKPNRHEASSNSTTTLLSSTTFIGSPTTLKSEPPAAKPVDTSSLKSSGRMHPRLAQIFAVVAQRREECKKQSGGAGRHPEDEEERLTWIRDENTVRGLRTEIDAELSKETEIALETAQAGNLNGSPPIAVLRSLRTRLDNAAALRRLQRHEQQTLRMTDLALSVEIGAMTAMLREVLGATMRSEQRLERGSPSLSDAAAHSEHALLLAIQRALEDASERGEE